MSDLEIDFFNDPRVSQWESNLDQAMSKLSAEHSYENGELNDETGPGLYVIQLSGDTIDDYASEMGLNPWEDSEIMYMDADFEELYENFRKACKEDGAIVVAGNGRIMDTNAYVEPPDWTIEEADTLKGWGAKHISASRISTIDDVVYTKALSSTTGDITTFLNGEPHKVKERDEILEEYAQDEES